jgi:hypothetical protein
MLASYLLAVQNLLQSPPAPQPLYSTANLTLWINTARGQLSGESKCIRAMGAITLTEGTNNYAFASVTIPNAATLGIQGVLDIGNLWYVVGSGQRWIRPRPWPWLATYELNNPVPPSGPPKVWSVFGQGAAAQMSPLPTGGGTFYVSPIPDMGYTVNVDAACLPVPLVDDTTPEAIPFLWNDAIPYFAAYLALLSAQTNARMGQAQQMFQLYTEFSDRARRASTPLTLPAIYQGVASPLRQNQLGTQNQRGAT